MCKCIIPFIRVTFSRELFNERFLFRTRAWKLFFFLLSLTLWRGKAHVIGKEAKIHVSKEQQPLSLRRAIPFLRRCLLLTSVSLDVGKSFWSPKEEGLSSLIHQRRDRLFKWFLFFPPPKTREPPFFILCGWKFCVGKTWHKREATWLGLGLNIPNRSNRCLFPRVFRRGILKFTPKGHVNWVLMLRPCVT